ncbi:MAG: carbohydrate-binding domain-containing protein, partial [Clostridia bacterium]
MKSKKTLIYLGLVIVLIVIIISIVILTKKPNQNTEKQADIDVSIEYKEEDENTNWKDENYEEVTLKESINITKAGTYHLTGNLEDGNITVKAGDNDLVKLVLDNVNITCSNSSAINIENAKKVIIIVEEGTTNTVTDGETYLTQDEPDAAIFSKDDLVINGTGILNINANYLDGIASKDGLKIVGTTLNVNSNDDGIRGKDYIGIKNANVTINASGDGIKSTNDTDTSKGYILIENSIMNIEAEQDGMQAETNLKIVDGKYTIKTGGGNTNLSTSETWGEWGMEKRMSREPQTTMTTTNEVSAKGIKGNSGILIESGTFKIDSSDDAIHSNGTITINNGTFEIQSGDDGIHADETININNGNINILKSYEGIESSNIYINGGNINLTASDDGINISGGNDASSINGRAGQNNFSGTTAGSLYINDGTIIIDSSGDGIDVNGKGYINGGKILVNGPTNSGNGALDYANIFEVSGGELIAVGSSGMMQAPSNGSKIYSISYVYNSTQEAGSIITIKNSRGEEIISCTATKIYNSVVVSSEKFEKGETYTIYSNGEKI